MNKKMKYIVVAFMSAALMMTGCVPKAETDIQRDPNFGEAAADTLNITQLHNDTLEAFGDVNNNPYVYISEVSVDGDPEAKSIVLSAKCMEEATDEDVMQFASALVRRTGEAMVIQLPQYEAGNQQSFGSCWNEFSLKLDIVNEQDGASRLSMEVPAGESIELNPDIETYEEEWIELRDKMLETAVYDVNGNIVEDEA
ncbi:MAG: hypothetical protein Q4B86_08265 [Eubacteriales bacterium]|nr:hypothetical protein [Eubacteriales bacterium]